MERAVISAFDSTDEAPVPPEDGLTVLAREALRKLRSLQQPTVEEDSALRVLLTTRRPALWVKNGKIEKWPLGRHELGSAWRTFLSSATGLLGAIGRIEAHGAAVGTGFVVSRNVVVTNNHVIEEVRKRHKRFTQVVIRLGLEDPAAAPPPGARLPRLTLLKQHATLDLALLNLRGDPGGDVAPLTIDAYPVSDDRPIVTIGYPFADARVPAYASDIFGDNYGGETVAPGRAKLRPDGLLRHDCATLGGNSGSPLIDLTTAKVVGVHFDGAFLERNLAIPAGAVREMLIASGV